MSWPLLSQVSGSIIFCCGGPGSLIVVTIFCEGGHECCVYTRTLVVVSVGRVGGLSLLGLYL